MVSTIHITSETRPWCVTRQAEHTIIHISHPGESSWQISSRMTTFCGHPWGNGCDPKHIAWQTEEHAWGFLQKGANAMAQTNTSCLHTGLLHLPVHKTYPEPAEPTAAAKPGCHQLKPLSFCHLCSQRPIMRRWRTALAGQAAGFTQVNTHFLLEPLMQKVAVDPRP